MSDFLISVAIVFGFIYLLIWYKKKQDKTEEEEKAKYMLATLQKCPKCGATGRIVKTNDTSWTYETTRIETRQLKHFNNDGDAKGYSEYDVEVPCTKLVQSFSLDLSCPSCLHKWTRVSDSSSLRSLEIELPRLPPSIVAVSIGRKLGQFVGRHIK
jgi:hypothetical protein